MSDMAGNASRARGRALREAVEIQLSECGLPPSFTLRRAKGGLRSFFGHLISDI
jgi:hypothetical protein